MSHIDLPKKISFKKDKKDKNSGEIIIEPCYPGYGNTLGNALRRVLLSSLPGAAVVGVKIDKVDHEFMGLPYLKEDILELILNLKKIRLKVFSDEVVKLELNVKGKKEFTAGDIKPNAEVEIVNPELYLGSLTDIKGSLDAEIFVSKGMGYVTVESRAEKQKTIGYIEMDSIFTPILKVGIKIDNVRVGKMTNWDRLTLNVETDGTITPEEAFKQANDILIQQFKALQDIAGNKKAESKPTTKENDKKTEEKNSDD